MKLHPKIEALVEQFNFNAISNERKEDLNRIVDYITGKLQKNETLVLNFICTHNSRRSQFSQLWGHSAAYYYNIPLTAYSGGVEVTAFNPRAVASVERLGFKVKQKDESTNPHYLVSCGPEAPELTQFSKVFDDPSSSESPFAAIMTCGHADENCPFIPSADARLPLRYNDPKAFDDTDQEEEMYDQRSKEIALELFYIFKQVKNAL